MITVPVTLTASDQNGNPVAGSRIIATLDTTEIYQGFVVPEQVEAFADANGVAVINLWPNALGVAGSRYKVRAWNPDTGKRFLDVLAAVPNSACNLHEILVQEPYPPIDAAQQALIAAQAALAPVTEQAAIATDAAEAAEADRIQTGQDAQATAADRTQTGLDRQATAADRIATGQDRVQTGQDRTATGADRLQTGLDRQATAADRIATGQDRQATAADRIATGQDKQATAADRVATGQDAAATDADRIAAQQAAAAALLSQQAAATSQNAAAASATTATTQAGIATTQAGIATTQANNAVAVVTGGTASLTAAAGRIPIADANAELDASWMTGIANNAYPIIRPTLDLDFINGATVDPRITFTRASSTTYYDGKTFAKAEENLLLNSATLTTQNVTTTAQPHTLSFEGTGTVTLSGTSTAGPLVGSTGRVSLTFTPTAGTLTLTVTGTVTNAQLEARSQATAYTPTTTQPITRFQPVLLTAPANTAVIDHDPVTGARLGLRVWEARTNLLLRSEEFDNAIWNKTGATVLPNQIVAPDGTTTAEKLVEDTTAAAVHRTFQTFTVVNNTTYTLSVYVKAAERNFIALQLALGFASTPAAYFNLANGTIGTTSGSPAATITSVGNGWYRCTITAVSNASGAGAQPYIYIASADGNTSYTGDGVSGIYLWGAQLEAGTSASPYIPTTTAQVTRAADVASMTGANFSSWYRQDEGTLFADCTPVTLSAGAGISANDGTANNRIRLAAVSTTEQGTVSVGGVNQAVLDGGTPVVGSRAIMAMSYRNNDFALSMNGGAAVTDALGVVPFVDRLRIGGETTTSGNLQIRHITYYPARLSNATLQAITKP